MIEGIIGSILSFIWIVISKTAIIWAPLVLMYYAFKLWKFFVTDRFISGIEFTLLEIEVPREVEKTPLAMELVFTNALYHASQKGLWDVWIKGVPHFWFSLEIVGIDGGVHFYIRTPSRVRELIETQIYAQYPQAKVKEVEDYAMAVPFDAPNDDWRMWGTEFGLEKHHAYPLRTYPDYGLDKASDKEQQKVDPLTPTIEFLGSLKKGQQVWIQHVVRPSKQEFKTKGKRWTYHNWLKESENQIEEEMKPYRRYSSEKPDGKGDLIPTIQMPKPVENRVNKMQDKMQKLGFDTCIRMVTLAEKEYCDGTQFENFKNAARLLFRQYSNPDGNSLVRKNSVKPMWKIKNRMLNWYQTRTVFHPPFWLTMKLPLLIGIFAGPMPKPEIIVLNTEELATIFHFPGQVSQAPSFERIESRVAKPPSNLPI